MEEPEEEPRRLGDRSLGAVVFSEAQIAKRVRELGEQINAHYGPADNLLMVGLLKGTFIFLADLVRHITLPLGIEFLVASSYGSSTRTSGNVQVAYEPRIDVGDRSVVIVEDIVDSGNTVNHIVPRLRRGNPKSLELCTLLYKRPAIPLVLEPRWVGFEAPDEFLVGYGLDHDEDFRHLPYIASLSSGSEAGRSSTKEAANGRTRI